MVNIEITEIKHCVNIKILIKYLQKRKYKPLSTIIFQIHIYQKGIYDLVALCTHFFIFDFIPINRILNR